MVRWAMATDEKGRDTTGLWAGDDRALANLGVQRLPAGYVSEKVRLRLPAKLMRDLQGMSAVDRSALIEAALRARG